MKQEERQTRLSEETEDPVSFDRNELVGYNTDGLSQRPSARAVSITRGVTALG